MDQVIGRLSPCYRQLVSIRLPEAWFDGLTCQETAFGYNLWHPGAPDLVAYLKKHNRGGGVPARQPSGEYLRKFARRTP